MRLHYEVTGKFMSNFFFSSTATYIIEAMHFISLNVNLNNSTWNKAAIGKACRQVMLLRSAITTKQTDKGHVTFDFASLEALWGK